MKILITMKLADRSLKYHVYPLTLLKEIDKIILVRDRTGPVINKVEYHCPPNWSLKIPVLALFFKFLKMVSLSIREKPSIVHAYLLFPHGILSFLTGKLTNIRCSMGLIAGPVELYDLFGDPIHIYSYCKPLPELHIIGKILLRMIKDFDIITVTGSYTENFLVNKGIDRSKIFVLPHILDSDFAFKNKTKEDIIYDIVFVGRLAKVKHIETLIKAIRIIKKYYPDIRVVIVGDGECRNYLEKLTKMLELTENINFVGYQSDIFYWYNKGMISILSSEREGFPYSVIESLSCGLPLVASNCGDICDFIKDGYNGIIVADYRNYHSFAEAILKLLRNSQLLNEYSINALKTSEEMNLENVTNVWKNIIKTGEKNEK